MPSPKSTPRVFAKALVRSAWNYLAAASVVVTLILLPSKWYWAIAIGVTVIVVVSAIRAAQIIRADYELQISSLQGEIETLKARPADETQNRVDAVEVSASIQQGLAQNFVILLKNDSDEVVRVKEVRLFSDNGIRVTDPACPPSEDQWTIQPRKGLQIGWRAQPDPAISLSTLKDIFGRNFQTEIHVALLCAVLERTKKFDCNLWVQVEPANRRIWQLAG